MEQHITNLNRCRLSEIFSESSSPDLFLLSFYPYKSRALIYVCTCVVSRTSESDLLLTSSTNILTLNILIRNFYMSIMSSTLSV